MAGTTYTYAQGANSYMKFLTSTIIVDDFTVNVDMPGELITPVGATIAHAQSAGIAIFAGSFTGRMVVTGGSSEQEDILETSNAFIQSSATFYVSSRHNYAGDILITQKTLSGGGGQVAKIAGTWIAGDDFIDTVA